ncbi:sodium:solute symporter [Pedosphaera parvula]|uniref:SSS sodium solute transporter superfamily n=1 Tax=Pedosphaera parvula (strain Ellin514) TaxID=320771 RepID=B9XFT5_PEDPL|nr:sodium:solute symporter [Pedosphaera parvula]EEF61449.1 SSS sodium solute transporter superfamily [Pedosphaera parvula Ellin514]
MDQVHLHLLDLIIFAVYMVATMALGFWVARKGKNTAQGYFLGNKTIPWFVIGASMVAADISSEQFISNVGGAYKHGIVLAAGDWNAWIIYSLLILIFLPYYVRTGVTTMPEFLERRYNPACRYIFAIASIIGFVAAINAGALYSGGIMLDSFFGDNLAKFMPHTTLFGNPISPVVVYIIFFAVTTGVYTIYGGLKSAAWTDLMQMVILLIAGFLVPILALRRAGDLTSFIQQNPEHFQVFKPITHKPFPATGLFTGFLSVGIWYSCTSQHMVQRILAAKNEWHARVGVVCAGFLHIIMPFFFIVPGIIAFKMFPNLPHPDQAYLVLVKELLPTGLKGLLLAGMAAALMGHVATVLNSASTIITIDLYKRLFNRDVTDAQQVRFGRWSGTLVLIASIWIAIGYTRTTTPLFEKIQTVFFYIAPPFAVVFTLGILWKRATATAAVITIILGFVFTWVLTQFALLGDYNTYNHRALCAWFFCMLTMTITSLVTTPPPEEQIKGIIWNKSFLTLPPEEQQQYRGLKDWRIWWLLFVAIVLSIYGFFLWHRFCHPW